MTNSMGEDTKIPTVGSMESVGTISYCSHGGSEGLGLGGGSVFSLVRLGDGLVRGLATSTSMTDKAMTSKSMSDNSRGMGNQRGSMNYGACSVNKRGSMDKRGLWVGCLTVISYFSD